jgi:Trk K+ transport system NAD-binding subunit
MYKRPVKFLGPQLAYLLNERQARRNLLALFKVVLVLVVTIAAYAVLFHLVMLYEGQYHSWVTGVYWTLTVMSTLGFGDITFHSDFGRIFSMIVLLTGLVLLLIVLPFAFIRFFYAPWLEAQIRLRAPREVPVGTTGHVIICRYDAIARGLIERLNALGIAYFVIEEDVPTAAGLHSDGISVVAGEIESSATYRALRADFARLVFANLDDAANTNITITVRECAADTPIAAIIADADSADILELAGATFVLPLKHLLGEHLASRVNAGHAHAHVVGSYRDLVIAEFPVHNTGLVARTIRDTRLRQLTGLNVVAYWERGQLRPARPDTVLSEHSVMVIVGTADQVMQLDAMFVIYAPNENPVLVIGGGEVGRAAARALKKRGVLVHIIEKDRSLESELASLGDTVFIGDANDRKILMEAGLAGAPSVLLTTHDDATNIYLAVYCRRLNRKLRIISRITHERNMEAIHRAGADFVLSYSSLGANTIVSKLLGREVVVLGEGVDLFVVPLPKALETKTLAESEIGAKTGLNVIAIQKGDSITTNPGANTLLAPGSELVLIGTSEQRLLFTQSFRLKK